jgi:phosphohistidine phosphatase
MKTIILVRHAKSSWDDFTVPDFDRPLNERGKRDAPVMAARLREHGQIPDLLLSSPAKRARKTARFFAETLGIDKESIQFQEELYLAEPETFAKVIAGLDDKYSCVAVFAHNPGITVFANMTGTARVDEMPTCAMFAYTMDTDHWAKANDAKKKFLFFDQPKDPSH